MIGAAGRLLQITSPVRHWARVLFVVSMTAVPARGDEVARHVVKAGESCASIAQRYYGDGRFVDLLHRANPELGGKPPPHILRDGMVLVIPPKPAERAGNADAELTAVRNRVEVLSPEPKQGKPNDPLFRGNRVSTEAASSADVTFRDETQVKLGERTLVVILGDARSAAAYVPPTETRTTLVTGNLRTFMGQAGRSSATVATDVAKVHVYDGEAQVSADPAKTTRLAVYRGSGAIDAHGRTREVARGFGSKVDKGSEPTEPRPLPPAPSWTTLPPLVLVDDGKGVTIVGEYAVASTRAASYHVQIARDGIFRDITVDTKVPSGVQRLEAQVPASGRYYIRVSAVDDDRFEGPFGPTARTLVIHPTKTTLSNGQRSIEIDPPDAFCVRVGNVPLTRITGHPIVVPQAEPIRVRCAPNDSDPTTLITLN